MKWKHLLLAIVLGGILPCFLLVPHKPSDIKNASSRTTESSTQLHAETTVRVLTDGEIREMSMDAYLTGVILGELPSYFHTQTLMAQAVVARTFTYRSMQQHTKHTDADICTDPSCCQAFIDPDRFLSQGGDASYLLRAGSAVENTKDMVIRYQGELIEATYFSCSGGRTEDAVAVWGTQIPYLQSTISPGEEQATHFTDTVRIPASSFCEKLGLEQAYVKIGDISYTRGGGVDTIVINGRSFTGMQLRSVLGLRSTLFVITPLPDHVVIITKGFGHRVGMSQYGAEAMAVSGSSYEQILSHYYAGTEVEKVER